MRTVPTWILPYIEKERQKADPTYCKHHTMRGIPVIFPTYNKYSIPLGSYLKLNKVDGISNSKGKCIVKIPLIINLPHATLWIMMGDSTQRRMPLKIPSWGTWKVSCYTRYTWKVSCYTRYISKSGPWIQTSTSMKDSPENVK